MALKFYRAAALPGSPTAADDGVWFVKPNGANPFKLYSIKNGTVTDLNAVTQAELTAALSAKADDNAVVKLTGNQTVAGIKTFSSSPVVPNATTGTQAVNKSQMDTADAVLQAQIDALETTIASGMQTPSDIDCSTNPNYPASDAGQTYIVTVAGKIGGAAGIDVTAGDMIVCKADSAAGTHATVGNNFFVVQSNINDATETVKGYIEIATSAEVISGTDFQRAVVPSTLQAKLDAEVVKLTGTQTVAGAKTFSTVPKSSQDASGATDLVRKSQFDSGLAAKADDNTVVKLTGNQTVAGVKTFSSSPVVPTATTGTQAVNKAQLDAAITASTVEWTSDTWV